jgi:hypothetical protein
MAKASHQPPATHPTRISDANYEFRGRKTHRHKTGLPPLLANCPRVVVSVEFLLH